MSDNRVPPEKRAQMAAENARQIDRALSRFEGKYNFNLLSEVGRSFGVDEEIDFKSLMGDTQAVQDLFNALKPTNERQELWERFNRFRDRAREARQAEKFRYDSRCNENKNAIYKALQNLSSKYGLDGLSTWVNGYRGDIKGFGADAADVQRMFQELRPLRKADNEELWNWFNKLRDVVTYIREQKEKDWRQDQLNYICKLEIQIDHDNEYLTKLYSQLSHCQDLLAGAKGDDFRDKAQGWVSEKEDKIADVTQQIQQKRDKIRDIRGKL